jgi:hypothetical protein
VLTVAEFGRTFGTDEACLEELKRRRWGANLERFACPACGHPQGWWLAQRRLVQCAECHHQTSVTAGTVFHGARAALWKRVSAAYQLAQDKKGIAALELAKQVGPPSCLGGLPTSCWKPRQELTTGSRTAVPRTANRKWHRRPTQDRSRVTLAVPAS